MKWWSIRPSLVSCMLVWSVHQLFGALCCRYRLSHLSVDIYYHSHWWVLLLYVYVWMLEMFTFHCILKWTLFPVKYIPHTHTCISCCNLCNSTVSYNLTDLATVRFLDGTNYSITNDMVPDKDKILFWCLYVAKPNWLRVGYPWLLTW